MMRFVPVFCGLALAATLAAPVPPAHAAGDAIVTASAERGKPRARITVRRYRGTPGYGFLPGYEPPHKAARHRRDVTVPWYGWPGFYRGRWNGGGFGPCYAKTPIGPVWICG